MSAAPQLAEELFNEHHRRIYLYCLRQLGSPEEAEDAVQATYLNACRSLKDGFEPEAAQAWLFKVAHNVCLTRKRSSYRRARVERAHDLQAVQDVVAAPELQGDELFGLEEALADLPDQQRHAILLREWQGLSYREVAAELGLTQAAVEAESPRPRAPHTRLADRAPIPAVVVPTGSGSDAGGQGQRKGHGKAWAGNHLRANGKDKPEHASQGHQPKPPQVVKSNARSAPPGQVKSGPSGRSSSASAVG
jgi:RNA polymerase sigma factor (sigma-70 family)